jgi:hypothetical protein
MVTQTVEAYYDNWHIELKEKIRSKRAKLYIVVVNEEESDVSPIYWSSEFLESELHMKWKKLLSNI